MGAADRSQEGGRTSRNPAHLAARLRGGRSQAVQVVLVLRAVPVVAQGTFRRGRRGSRAAASHRVRGGAGSRFAGRRAEAANPRRSVRGGGRAPFRGAEPMLLT